MILKQKMFSLYTPPPKYKEAVSLFLGGFVSRLAGSLHQFPTSVPRFGWWVAGPGISPPVRKPASNLEGPPAVSSPSVQATNAPHLFVRKIEVHRFFRLPSPWNSFPSPGFSLSWPVPPPLLPSASPRGFFSAALTRVLSLCQSTRLFNPFFFFSGAGRPL